MRTIGSSFLDYLGRQDVNVQVQNDIRIITEKSKKKRQKQAVAPKSQEVKDSYEQAMDTSKYDQILSELIT